MPDKRIYFDHAATTAIDSEVLRTYNALLEQYYNSDALYDEGVAVYRMQEKARTLIKELLGLSNSDIIFTSGASEANSLAIKGLALAGFKRRHIITSLYEHASVYNAVKQLADVLGYEVTYLKPHKDGKIYPEDVLAALKDDTLLVSIMHVNNEIGAINDIDTIGRIVKKYSGAYFHSDITQSLGKIAVPLDNVDMASFSAHKIHGVKGSGALIKRRHIKLEPLISGGQQEYGMRGGTSNAPANIVLAKTLRLAIASEKENYEKVSILNKYLLEEMSKLKLEINSFPDGIKHLINFSTPVKSEVMLNYFNLRGIMVSSRSTCGSRENEPSRVLSCLDIDDERAIRLSLGGENTLAESRYFIEILKEALEKYG